MKETDIELGKELVLNYYKIGHWYRFNTPDTCANIIKYLKVEKIDGKKDKSRIYLKGKGFSVLINKDHCNTLYNPKTSKDEAILYCWAEEYIKKYYEVDETIVRNAYKTAMENSFNKMFEDK